MIMLKVNLSTIMSSRSAIEGQKRNELLCF